MAEPWVIGEVHTGLLRHSSAVSLDRCAALVSLVAGEPVYASSRPIAFACSPEQLVGVDCNLPTSTNSLVRGVGTVITRASITGGHIVQASAYASVEPAEQPRRRPWSHYLTRRGVLETISKIAPAQVADGFIAAGQPADLLDLGAISRRTLDRVQHSPYVDRRAAVRTTMSTLRFAIGPATGAESVTIDVDQETVRLRLQVSGRPIPPLIAWCEDVARHDWLLSTVGSITERSLAGNGGGVAPRDAVTRLQPAVVHLLHLWMPDRRATPATAQLWSTLDRQIGMDRQWRSVVNRIRDQLALAAVPSN